MAAADVLSPSSVIGGRYLILAAAGREGSCLRYRAQDLVEQRTVIVAEFFPPGIAARMPDGSVVAASEEPGGLYQDELRRFVARAQKLTQLASRALPSCSGPLHERNTGYAITELIEGPDLGDWSRELRRPPTQTELDAVLDPVLEALATLHAAGLVHAAITPGAIVFSDARKWIVTRLWAAPSSAAEADRSDDGAAYAAPEVLQSGGSITPRSDVYGLAATIHLLLTGTPPGRPADATVWMPPALAPTDANYRPEFVQAVALSLAPNPSQRPPSAAALRSLLLDEVAAQSPAEPERMKVAPPVEERDSPGAVPIPGTDGTLERLRTRVPWLPILALGAVILAGLGYLGLRPSLPPPGRTTPPAAGQVTDRPAPDGAPQVATHSDEKAKVSAEVAKPGAADQAADGAIARRIAQATDRGELQRLAEAEPAQRAAVEQRLAALGFVQIIGRDRVEWLRPGGSEGFSECADCPEMVPLPGGTFRMGSPPTEPGRRDDEDDTSGPGGTTVSTAVKPFAVARYEITRGQFAAFVKETGFKMPAGCFARSAGRRFDAELIWKAPGFPQDDRHPVTCVSWDDAAAYADWLGTKTGAKYRLLRESEWEYAARAGSTTPFSYGDREKDLCQYANGADQTAGEAHRDWRVAPCKDGFVETAPVGSFKANAFGLHDMHGNVSEWVADCESEDLRHWAAAGRNPQPGCSMDAARIVRGGSWIDPPQRLRSAARIAGAPDERDQSVGFRVARSLEPIR